MKFFSQLYARVMSLARHRHATYYLIALSAAESSFFPVPPDVMLAPMSLAKPQKAWYFATLTTLASVLGGLLGYLLGFLAFASLVMPLLASFHYTQQYAQVVTWFAHWGLWVVFLAAFSPIPYKLFTLAAGALQMPVLPFLCASLVGRSSRFFLVASLMKWGGNRASPP